LEIDPQHDQARFNQANLLFEMGQFAEAKHTYQIFIDGWKGEPRFTQFAQKRVATCEDYVRRTLK
ncbi:MAG: tetratricopeptide repeat protein, partial [bacterium]|nr:tetratricopeptide repeat protein [bacterium]